MSLYTLPNSTSGIDLIFTDTMTTLPSFTPMILLFVFFTILLGGIGRQKQRLGTADYPMWMVIASLGTFLTATIMTMATGFINLAWYTIVIAITILSAVLLFLDRKPSEV